MSLFRSWLRKLGRRLVGPDPLPTDERVRSLDCGLVDAVMAGWFQNHSNELFRGFPISPDDVVLDVGCGAGGASLFCARRGAHVIFTDSDAGKIAALEERVRDSGARKVEGWVSDSLPLPVADGQASRIVALEMLEHVEQPGAILRELFRVGQPGALYFLSVPAQVSEELQRPLAPAAHFQAPNHINVFSEAAFAQLVTDAGLVIESRHSYGFYWTLWMMLYWTLARAEGRSFEGATHDQLAPPHHALLDDWATLWHRVIHLPGGDVLREGLDRTLPKTQIILARKPLDACP